MSAKLILEMNKEGYNLTRQRMIILFSCISLLLLTTSVYSAANRSTNGDMVKVQLLGMNDFHGQLNTYQEIFGQKVGGAEYVAAYINKLKLQQKHTLLVHAGDMIGASPPISALYQDEPTIEFLNLLNVDIGTLGNHEFDNGVQEMQRLLSEGHDKSYNGTTTSYISANVIEKKTNSPLFPAFTIKEINGIKIGFIGVVTTETNDFVVYKNREQVDIIDEVTAINQATKQLMSKGVKAIVVLAHVSAKSNLTGDNPEQAMVKMAPLIHDEVDVIFAGHNHAFANTLVDDKLIVQGYSYGKAISQVQLELDSRSGEIIKKNANIHLTLHEFIEPDKETIELINKYKSKLNYKMDEVIMTATKSISRKKDKQGESLLAIKITKSMMEEMNTDIAFIHHGGIRLSLNKGDITVADIYRSLPFNHKVVKIKLTGKQIKAVLEQQWKNNKENLLQTGGVSYHIEENTKAGGKIKDLRDNKGKEIIPSQVYTVAISDYLALGGDGFTAFKTGKIISTGAMIKDVFIKYIKNKEVNE
jgi:5'-nucleotidase